MLATLLATSFLARLAGDLLVAIPVAGLAIYGWQHGLFLATIAGLQLLGSFVAALAFAPAVATALEVINCPPAQSIGVAYLAVFLGGLLATRLAIGGFVPEGVVRFAPIIDKVCGACLGAVAGFLLAGSLLVGWSLLTMPESFRLDVASLKLDAGSRLLATFARCVEPDQARRTELLGGDPDAGGRGLLDCYRECDWRKRISVVPPEPPSSGDGAGENLGEVDRAGPDAAPAAE
jgi:uncharacterized membrane protein required for colicin V production